SPSSGAPPSDAFTQFWSDVMSRMTAAGFVQPAADSEGLERMQRIFFDAMAKYADEFMRSPQFLESLKATMDNAMAFRRQLDQWITSSLQSAQMPTHSDMTDVVARIHSMEKRVLERMDELDGRVGTLENGHPRPRRAATQPARGENRK